MYKHLLSLSILVSFIGLIGCGGHQLDKGSQFSLSESSFSSLKGWEDDQIREAMPALLLSCNKPSKKWKSFCKGLQSYQYASPQKIRSYLEDTLQPYEVSSYGDEYGKITGYYEAELTGTRTKIRETQIPIYGVPRGYKYGQKRDSRAKIERTKNYARIIAWADDPVDLFILHIQGSGRLKTPDGNIRLSYAGNNGYTFKPLSAILKENNIKLNAYSMPNMKKWLQEHPQQARELMAENPRYIFFKEGEARGAAGIPLTPKRSVAVDKRFIPMHTPMWLETHDPDKHKLNRLVVAQDTGNAITGAIRADFFWGYGHEAFDKAGRMHSRGKYYLLLPKE